MMRAAKFAAALDLPGDILDVWDCFFDPVSRSTTRLVYKGGGSANRVTARKACASPARR